MEFLQYDEMDVEETSNLVCEMCSEGQRLYKCPRCSLFTCSLKCCNDHKVKVIIICLIILCIYLTY